MAKEINEEILDKYSGIRAENDVQYKGISIVTRRYPPFNMFDKVERYVDLRNIVSLIQFSKPCTDFKKREYKKLYLETSWFGEVGYQWKIQLADKDRAHMQSIEFNILNEHFSSYTEERLKRWQEDALCEHQKYLSKIEGLYWQNKPIPKDFFE
jgi:hypothetical protein